MRVNTLNNRSKQRKFAISVLPCFFSAFFLASLSSQSAYAESQQCRALRGQLTKLNVLSTSSSPKSANFKHFDSLFKRQAKALKHAKRDAVGLQCISRSGKRTGKGAASCPSLLNKIGKMQNNLKKLGLKRDRAQPAKTKTAAQVRKEKQKVRRKIQKLRCGSITRQANNSDPREQRGSIKKAGLLERLFGGQRRKRRAREERFRQQQRLRLQEQQRKAAPQNSKPSLGRVYRTMCVRVCDGYYFPINFATVRKNFDNDRAFCEASNPSTEMRLFFHHNPSESTEDMKDLAGRLYAELPNAFRHRREVVSNQICPRRPTQSAFKQIAGAALGEVLAEKQSRLVNAAGQFDNALDQPSPKPDIFIDADTHMAQIGRFHLKSIKEVKEEIIATNVITTYDPSKIADTGVRVIGPTFLDDQQSVKLLLAPDQIQVQ
ncbi:MAG: DUF2865 domain-containing protein [Hyphomicrobiales bacterium]